MTGSMCVSLSVEGSPPRPEYDWVSPWWKVGMGPTRPPRAPPLRPCPCPPQRKNQVFQVAVTRATVLRASTWWAHVCVLHPMCLHAPSPMAPSPAGEVWASRDGQGAAGDSLMMAGRGGGGLLVWLRVCRGAVLPGPAQHVRVRPSVHSSRVSSTPVRAWLWGGHPALGVECECQRVLCEKRVCVCVTIRRVYTCAGAILPCPLESPLELL